MNSLVLASENGVQKKRRMMKVKTNAMMLAIVSHDISCIYYINVGDFAQLDITVYVGV